MNIYFRKNIHGGGRSQEGAFFEEMSRKYVKSRIAKR